MFCIEPGVVYTAPRRGFGGGLLAGVYCGLIIGWTANCAMFVGRRRLDKVLLTLNNCERLLIFKLRAALPR